MSPKFAIETQNLELLAQNEHKNNNYPQKENLLFFKKRVFDDGVVFYGSFSHFLIIIILLENKVFPFYIKQLLLTNLN
jgi:hypothetical protein